MGDFLVHTGRTFSEEELKDRPAKALKLKWAEDTY
jgi:hypothetical protein